MKPDTIPGPADEQHYTVPTVTSHLTLQARTLLMVTGLLAVAVVVTATALTFNARQVLLSQKQFDGQLIAELLARSVKFADETANDVDDAIGQQMIVEAALAAHLVAAAEAGGASPEAINARLRDITRRTVLSEFWITDEEGHAYLRSNPDIDFTFSPDPRIQPQAHAFWGLLTGERPAVVQEIRKREVDDQIFKYAGVTGVDKPRIVQVGFAAPFLERLRREVGLSDLVDELMASGKVTLIQVLDPSLVTVAYSALPGQTAAGNLSQPDADYLKQALAGRQTLSYLDGTTLKVVAPIIGGQDRVIGAAFVQLPTPHMQAASQSALELASLVAAGVLVTGLVSSIILARRVTRPVERLTTAARAVETAHFEPESLDDVARRKDELGQLARVFQRMAREVYGREQRLKEEVSSLRIEIDEAKKARQVAEITETDYFQHLQQRAKQLRNRGST